MPRSLHIFLPLYRDLPSFLRLRLAILAALPGGFEARFHLLDDSAGEDRDLSKLDLPETPLLARAVPPPVCSAKVQPSVGSKGLSTSRQDQFMLAE